MSNTPDKGFIYLYETEIPRALIVMLDYPDVAPKHVVWPTITHKKISVAPYQTFRERLVASLHAHEPLPHNGILGVRSLRVPPKQNKTTSKKQRKKRNQMEQRTVQHKTTDLNHISEYWGVKGAALCFFWSLAID